MSSSKKSTFAALEAALDLRTDHWRHEHRELIEIFLARDLSRVRFVLAENIHDDPIRQDLLNSLNKIDHWQSLAVIAVASILLLK